MNIAGYIVWGFIALMVIGMFLDNVLRQPWGHRPKKKK